MQILSFFSTGFHTNFSWRSVVKKLGDAQFLHKTNFINLYLKHSSWYIFSRIFTYCFFLFCRSSNSFQNLFEFIRFEAVSFLGNWGFMVFLRGFISGWGKDSKLDDSWLICLLNWRLFWRYILLLIRRYTAQNWYGIQNSSCTYYSSSYHICITCVFTS